jgi:hypothetical protein
MERYFSFTQQFERVRILGAHDSRNFDTVHKLSQAAAIACRLQTMKHLPRHTKGDDAWKLRMVILPVLANAACACIQRTGAKDGLTSLVFHVRASPFRARRRTGAHAVVTVTKIGK